MRRCSRLILLGEGNVELRMEEEFEVGELARFGVLPTDTLASPAPVPSGRLVVYAGSDPDPGEAEVEFDGSSIASGTFIVSGEFEWEDPPPVVGQAGYFYGSVRANSVDLDDGNLVFTYDPTSRIGLSFMRLRSWKDQ